MRKNIIAAREQAEQFSESQLLNSTLALLFDLVIVLLYTTVFITVIVLFTGLWPPTTAVISGSMEPGVETGDSIILYSPTHVLNADGAGPNALVTKYESEDSDNFGQPGEVVVFTPHGKVSEYDVIHRLMFYVEEGENWYERGNPEYIDGTSCFEIRNCPAPNSGYITKGDANERYDQVMGISKPVPEENVRAVAKARLPGLGNLRMYIHLE